MQPETVPPRSKRTPDRMSPSKSVPALPSLDVPAQKPSELAEPPS